MCHYAHRSFRPKLAKRCSKLLIMIANEWFMNEALRSCYLRCLWPTSSPLCKSMLARKWADLLKGSSFLVLVVAFSTNHALSLLLLAFAHINKNLDIIISLTVALKGKNLESMAGCRLITGRPSSKPLSEKCLFLSAKQ